MTAATLTLTAFLEQRIAEDEAAARQNQPVGRPLEAGSLQWFTHGSTVGDRSGHVVAYGVEGESARAHIARHDPARALAECAAHRAIVDFHVVKHDREGVAGFNCHTLRTLASIYASHPDFDEAWR